MASRRRFLSFFPAALAGGVSARALAQQPAPSGPVTTAALQCAETIAGLDFTDAEGEMMLADVNRNLSRYESLRALHIPQGTEPAVHFTPHLPGKAPAGASTPGAPMPRASKTPRSGRLPRSRS